MKKILSALLALTILGGTLAGCAGKTDDKSLKVGASPTPHAEILREAAKQLEEEGYTIEIVEFTDYALQNTALDSKEIDANFFQHQPYLDEFNAQNGTELVSVGTVHCEPLGLYAGKTASIDALPDGAQIAVPNDASNEARALLLLQENGLITLREDAGVNATQTDIVENPKNIKIQEIAAEQLTRSLPDVDMAVINGNYAILGGLKVADALASEKKDSLAAATYANVVAVRKGDEERPAVQALMKALKSDAVKQFINDSYAGAVVAVD